MRNILKWSKNTFGNNEQDAFNPRTLAFAVSRAVAFSIFMKNAVGLNVFLSSVHYRATGSINTLWSENSPKDLSRKYGGQMLLKNKNKIDYF